MPKWEYHFHAMEMNEVGFEEHTAKLCKLGDEGWEAVSMMAKASSVAPYCITLFKRLKTK